MNLELIFLVLFLFFLPLLEAPKNYFLAAFIFVSIVRNRKKIFLKPDFSYMVLILSALCAAFFAGIPGNYEWKGFLTLLFFYIAGIVFSRFNYPPNIIKKLFFVPILGALPVLIFSLFRSFQNPLVRLELHSVGHVNHTAIYLSILAILTLFASIYGKYKNYLGIYLFFIGLLYLESVIFSQSRIAFFICLLFGLLVFLFFPGRKKIALVLTLSLVFLLSFFLTAPVFTKNNDNIKNNDFLAGRDKIWNIVYELKDVNPIFGIGNGNWKVVNEEYIRNLIEYKGELYNPQKYYFTSHPHNLYLLHFLERGWFGFSALIIFMFSWAKCLIKDFRRFDEAKFDRNILYGGSFAAFLVTFGIGFFNTTLHHEHGLLALFYYGLYISYKRKTSTFV